MRTKNSSQQSLTGMEEPVDGVGVLAIALDGMVIIKAGNLEPVALTMLETKIKNCPWTPPTAVGIHSSASSHMMF